MTNTLTKEEIQRKKYLTYLLTEAVGILKEQAPPMSAVPPTAPPAAAVTGVPQTGAETPAGAPQEAKPFTVDEMIERLNVVRSGKSFSDPEVYGQLTSYFKSMPDADRAVVDKFLQGLGKVVIQVSQDQGQTNSAAPPPPPPPPPGGAAPGGPLGSVG